MKKLNNERYQFRTLTGYDHLVVTLSGRAGEWLAGTTKTNDGYIVSHRTLMNDLLSRMHLTADTSTGFRRALSERWASSILRATTTSRMEHWP